MASVQKERRNGRILYRIQFYDKDKRRRSIRLSSVNKKAAESIAVKVDDLVSATIAGGSPSNETSRWLATIGSDLAAKLTNAGFGAFVPKRESATLGAFLDTYIDGRRAESADSTIANFKQLQRSLVTYFGVDCDLRKISEGDADDWRQAIVDQYAEATISKHVKRARQVFKAAMRKGLVENNVFSEVKGGSEQNDERKHFVKRDTTERIIGACPDVEWRTIVALARFGGVRTPSETLSLRWTDIDWENGRFTVTSPKTKKQGKPWRVVPLFPELRQHLADAFEQAADGAEFVITRYRDRNCNLRTQFNRILKRAGVTPWARLFQNLRASRETELANTFPLHVVTEWLGNTPAIAMKHYLQVTDAHYQQANEDSGGARGGAMVVQQVVPSASGGDCQEMTETKQASGVAPDLATFPKAFETCGVPPKGLEPLTR
ncbi:MAG: site-specific integrase [Planctomycetes bacterium]|nr:site-specific integrase [Planctomycetota bacterium]